MPSGGNNHTNTHGSANLPVRDQLSRKRGNLKTTPAIKRRATVHHPVPSSLLPILATSKSNSTSLPQDQPGSDHITDQDLTRRSEKVGRRISFKLPESHSTLTRRHSSVVNTDSSSMQMSPHDVFERKLGKEAVNFRRSSKDLAASLANLPQSQSSQNDLGMTQNKRGSISGQAAPPSRLSFQSVGRKVTTLLKFRSGAQPRKANIAEEQVISPTEIVEDLPKSPRFSSFMSAEAQYSLLKGYEDIIAHKLSSEYPQYNGKLKRNKTPHHGIIISELNNFDESPAFTNRAKQNEDDEDDRIDRDLEAVRRCNVASNSRTHTNNESTIADPIHRKDSGNLQLINTHESALFRRNRLGSNNASNESPSPSQSPTTKEQNLSPLENLGRLSLSFPAKASKTSDEMTDDEDHGRTFQSGIVPAAPASSGCLDDKRRLILSYRMERAMDLLDVMKSGQEHALSPRVKVKTARRAAPVKDYNLWANSWATEFKTNKIK